MVPGAEPPALRAPPGRIRAARDGRRLARGARAARAPGRRAGRPDERRHRRGLGVQVGRARPPAGGDARALSAELRRKRRAGRSAPADEPGARGAAARRRQGQRLGLRRAPQRRGGVHARPGRATRRGDRLRERPALALAARARPEQGCRARRAAPRPGECPGPGAARGGGRRRRLAADRRRAGIEMNPQRLRELWNERAPRERALLAGGALAIALVVLYLFLWQPGLAASQRLAGTLPKLRAQLELMRAQQSEIAVLRKSAGTAASGGD